MLHSLVRPVTFQALQTVINLLKSEIFRDQDTVALALTLNVVLFKTLVFFRNLLKSGLCWGVCPQIPDNINMAVSNRPHVRQTFYCLYICLVEHGTL